MVFYDTVQCQLCYKRLNILKRWIKIFKFNILIVYLVEYKLLIIKEKYTLITLQALQTGIAISNQHKELKFLSKIKTSFWYRFI